MSTFKLSDFSQTTSIGQAFRSWVHPSVGTEGELAARHHSLIFSHLAGGALSAIVFAIYFSWVGAPGTAALIACLCFLSQLAIAVFLSRTGALEIAHLCAAVNLTGLISVVAVLSGGSASFAVVWLALVPLEAALSTNKKVMAAATLLAVGALLGLHVATTSGAISPAVAVGIGSQTLALVCQLGAAIYAGALAASIQRLHRRTAREIEQGREDYRLIAENANDLITRHDGTGRVTFASLASRHILGLEPPALAGDGLRDLIAPADRARYQQALAHCLTHGVPVAEEFAVSVAGDADTAKQIWLEMRCQPVRASGRDACTQIIVVTRDITDRKAELIEISRARDEALRASNAKSAFIATMSHELRTPLNAIIGFSELLHRELLIKAREPKHADYCRTIHQSGEHLLSLVRDLLDISKIESGKLSIVSEPFDVADVARSAVETLRPLALSKNLQLSCDIPDGLPDMLADCRAVRQILINLVSNACKFTDPGGTVSVNARVIGSKIELAVSDTGIGIPPEHMSKIGRPFHQVDTRYSRQNEGAGLGLSIVRGLVQLHNGEMFAESKQGRGSRFRVLLDADQPGELSHATDDTVSPTADIVSLQDMRARNATLQEAATATSAFGSSAAKAS